MISQKIDALIKIVNSKVGLRSDERSAFAEKLKDLKLYVCCLPQCEEFDIRFIDENDNILKTEEVLACTSTQIDIGGCIAIMTADFESDFTTIDEGLNIQFTDLTNNNPTNWYWDFGDGSYSTLQNPIHSYASAGLYTVTLITAKDGAGDIETKIDYMTVTDPNAL